MRLHLPGVMLWAAIGLLPVQAQADEYDTLNVTVGASVTYDSNLFRLPDGTDAPANFGGGRSDLITVGTVGLRLNKPYSQQRFLVDVSQSFYRYNNFSFLDFEALNYDAAWLWHLTPRISGTLTADRTESLAGFQDVRTFQQVIRVRERYGATMDAWLTGPWHLLLGVRQTEQKDSKAVTAEQSFEASSYEFGLKYLATSGNWLALKHRRSSGDYVNRPLDAVNLFDNAFREYQTELSAEWKPTGMSALSGHVSWLERTHPNFSPRDFSGPGADIVYTWTPRAKLRFDASASRTITTWWDDDASYRTNNIFSFVATWEATAKVSAGARLTFIERDYRGAVGPVTAAPRNDSEHNAQVFVVWKMLRNSYIRASIEHLARSSNRAGLDYDAFIATLSASLLF